MFSVHGSIGGKTVYPGHQKRYDQSALHLMKTIPGCAFLTTVFIQNRLLPADGVSVSTSEQVAGIKSHLSDERGVKGLHFSIPLDRYTLPSRERGLESAATDEDEKRGTHLKRNGVGAGVVKTPSMSARGLESAATDEDEKRGAHLKRHGEGAGVVKTPSMSARGLESAATDEDEKRGAHLKRQGEGAGVVKTMSMSARGSASLGSQRIERPIMLLQLVSSTVEPDAPPMSKITRNQADIVDVLLKNQFFKKNTGQTRARIKEWKDAASNSDDNSHPFTTKPRSTNARRATDKWKLSHHESVEAVKLIAPDAEEVTADDRAVSASYREGEAQRSKESRKRKP